jgi:transcriptional regulator with XRE-family HTH domain
MEDLGRIRRAGQHELAGRARSKVVALRLGTALREARMAAGLEQSEVASRAGVSQPLVSYLERGQGGGTTLETWSRVAAAVGEQFVAFLEHSSGANQPRDLEHLKRQSALISIAARGGWQALPELAIDPFRARSRSIDVALIRRSSREAIAAEIWDWFDDVGAGFRSLDAKRTTLASASRPPTVGTCVVSTLFGTPGATTRFSWMSARCLRRASPASRPLGSGRSRIRPRGCRTGMGCCGATGREPA